MTLTIHLTPEEEDRLRDEAARRGLEAEEFARKMIVDSLPVSTQEQAPLTDEEFDALLDELSEGLDSNIPPLSNYALSRESFYEGRD